VKRVEKRRLIKVFRDDEQHEKRIVGDRISLEESPVFMRFSQGPAGKKIVYISDTEQMTLLEDKFRSRASVCGYRSILAFPLRMPRAFPRDGSESTAEGEDSVKIANLLGFFSIDTPDVGTLDGLLEGSRSIRDDDREPKGDLDIFYGLADSMATILMLVSEAATQGGGNTG